MRFKRKISLLSPLLALVAVLVLVTSASAGRAWCRADPVLMLDGDVVDIQVSSSLAMYRSAAGPIEMVVTVPNNVRANVLLQDFGFGRGYDVEIVRSDALDPGVRARVALRAPASDSTLPVTVHGSRVSLSLSGLFGRNFNVLWVDDAKGGANEWIVLDVR